MERKGFKFYKSYWDVASDMNDSDFKEFVSAMCIYYFEDQEPTFSNPMIEKFFSLVKPNIDSNIKRQTDGAKGGRTSKGTSGNEEDATSDSDKKHVDNTKGYQNEKPVVNTSGYQNEKPVVNTSALSDKDIDIDIDKDIDKDLDLDFLFQDVPTEIRENFIEWNKMRIERKVGLQSKNAVNRFLKKLEEQYPNDYENQNKSICQALDGGYLDFRPLKEKPTAKSKTSSRLGFLDEFAKGEC